MGKPEHMRFPVHVVEDIKVRVIRPVRFLCVSAPVQDPELPPEIFKFRFPGVFAVVGDIRTAAGLVVHDPWFPVHVEHLVGFPEGDQAFHKLHLVHMRLQELPV